MYEALEPSYQSLEHIFCQVYDSFVVHACNFIDLFSHTCCCTQPVADERKTKVGLEFVKKRGECVEFHVISWWNQVKFHGRITLDEKNASMESRHGISRRISWSTLGGTDSPLTPVERNRTDH